MISTYELNRVAELLGKRNAELVAQREDVLMGYEEAACFLHTSVGALRARVCRGQVPFKKRCRRVYFLRSELMDWVKKGV